MNLIWKLLKENISKAQLIGFFVANLVGMTIVLIACQFYFDVSPVFNKKDTLFKRDFFTITKKVGFLSGMSSGWSQFTDKEIEDLKKTGFVKDIGVFTSSQFSVFAGINQGDIQFSTDMFFESVPDKFIDVKTSEWRFSPVDNTVPIILPKNYLDLYNFGFAESRGMPKISEGMMSMINLDIMIIGQKDSKRMSGRVVGFSNRLNTILVPETFMAWANGNYGTGLEARPSRLILEINNITDPKVDSYFKQKGYEIGGDNSVVSRMSSFLNILVGIVLTVGIVISILSFVILVLSIYLLLEKNMRKLQLLRLLGYGKLSVTKSYEILVIVVNGVILVLSLLFVFLAKMQYNEVIKKVLHDYEPVGLLNVVLLGVGISATLTLINILIIRNKVK